MCRCNMMLLNEDADIFQIGLTSVTVRNWRISDKKYEYIISEPDFKKIKRMHLVYSRFLNSSHVIREKSSVNKLCFVHAGISLALYISVI